MWTEFEWENKVNVNTTISDLRQCECDRAAVGHAYPASDLNHIMSATNMSCLTPEGALEGDCGFLSANMYARSLFGKFTSYITNVDH